MSGILIIEDEFFIGLDLARSIEAAGFPVLGIASSCPSARQFEIASRPDIVIADIAIRGDVDGLECAQAIQARSGSPFIVCSGYRASDFSDRFSQGAPIAWFEKPAQTPQVIDAVIEIYGRRIKA